MVFHLRELSILLSRPLIHRLYSCLETPQLPERGWCWHLDSKDMIAWITVWVGGWLGTFGRIVRTKHGSVINAVGYYHRLYVFMHRSIGSFHWAQWIGQFTPCTSYDDMFCLMLWWPFRTSFQLKPSWTAFAWTQQWNKRSYTKELWMWLFKIEYSLPRVVLIH